MTAPSNIRVAVQWANSTVFAGEDIECTITFTNIAAPPSPSRSPTRRTPNGAPRTPRAAPPAAVVAAAAAERQQKLGSTTSHTTTGPVRPANLSRTPSAASQALPQQHAQVQLPSRGKGHRPALSVSTTTPGSPRSTTTVGVGAPNARHRHGRSLSIISIGTDTTMDASRGKLSAPGKARGHGRSASMQVMPRSAMAASPSRRTTTAPYSSNVRAYPSTAPVEQTEFPPSPHSRLGRSDLSSRPSTPGAPRGHKRGSASVAQSFKFPAAPPPEQKMGTDPSSPLAISITPHDRASSGDRSPRPQDDSNGRENLAPSPVSRVISASSMNGTSRSGTPRSSGEFYSMGSNNSSETVGSEYISRPNSRLLHPKVPHARQVSNLVPSKAETLMMGYAQVMGTFTLDGSLVNQAPFEDVKRKGVVGGQGGGGVVGIERSKRDSGLFGALSWGNFGESIGGLLGGGELSSMKEMQGIARAKTVPLLSTPQSILFVDLKLAPGESKSYKYAFTLPRGLPPTHKGRAIKVNYHVTIGTQRPGSSKDKLVKQVDVPFRVMGSVTGHGEILGHDLMSPYIILRDTARTSVIPSGPLSPLATPKPFTPKPSTASEGSLDDFVHYAQALLDRPSSHDPLLSPSAEPPSSSYQLRRTSSLQEPEPQTMKESIDFAILRSSHAPSAASTFRISRAGHPVAVLSLTRPAFRLGEIVHLCVDFSTPSQPSNGHHSRTTSRTTSPLPPPQQPPPQHTLQTHTLLASLETTESIDPAIAIRSSSSISRVTRRIHGSAKEFVGFNRRVVLALQIPTSATPEFMTSGVGLNWGVRVEFAVATSSTRPPPKADVSESEDETEVAQAGGSELLEEVAGDDRGVILAPLERVPLETFEVNVPLRIYGAVDAAGLGVGVEGQGTNVEGLVI